MQRQLKYSFDKDTQKFIKTGLIRNREASDLLNALFINSFDAQKYYKEIILSRYSCLICASSTIATLFAISLICIVPRILFVYTNTGFQTVFFIFWDLLFHIVCLLGSFSLFGYTIYIYTDLRKSTKAILSERYASLIHSKFEAYFKENEEKMRKELADKSVKFEWKFELIRGEINPENKQTKCWVEGQVVFTEEVEGGGENIFGNLGRGSSHFENQLNLALQVSLVENIRSPSFQFDPTIAHVQVRGNTNYPQQNFP